MQLTLELQRDWSRKETYEGITNIVRDHFGAYGMGIDYAASMVHDYGQRAKYLHKVIQSQNKA
ncbi:hypothetical protein SC404_10730 [Legionella pneumophila serogroup 1]